jgi:hypothetical protein
MFMPFSTTPPTRDLSGRQRAVTGHAPTAGSGFSFVPADGYRYTLPATPHEPIAIQRSSDDNGTISDGLIESMIRELLRAAGADAWEPAPE